MRELIYQNPDHFMFTVVLLSRLLDIFTTYIGTPKLKLEINPIARKLGWIYCWSTTLVAFIAYYHIWQGLIIAIISFIIALLNASRLWLIVYIGEDNFTQYANNAALKIGNWRLLGLKMIQPFILFVIGIIMVFFCPSENNMQYYISKSFVYASIYISIFIIINSMPKTPKS